MRASVPLDRQVKVDQNDLCTSHPRRALPDCHSCQSQSWPKRYAQLMNRHKSTISRELRCNRGLRGYRPKQAHELSQGRMRACENGPRVAAKTWAVVDIKLAETWSPERISGYLKVNGQPGVSHESIYRRIYADKSAGGTLHRTLRCRKARNKRYGGRERRGRPQGAPGGYGDGNMQCLICRECRDFLRLLSWSVSRSCVTGRVSTRDYIWL